MQKGINFVKLLKGYKKRGWVAISDDFTRVLSHGRTIESAKKKVKDYTGKIYYFPSGETYENFVGSHSR